MSSNSSEIVGAWPPPEGVIPNFDNPESIAPRVIVTALVCPVVAVLFVLMRSYTKKVIFNRFDLDDCMCLSDRKRNHSHADLILRLDYCSICTRASFWFDF
jgi:hypothetical protein